MPASVMLSMITNKKKRKQMPRVWFDRLESTLLQWGFTNAESDVSLFIFKRPNVLLLCLVYVDDILLTGSNSVLLNKLVKDLNNTFALKDLETLHYFLGIKAFRDKSGLYFFQSKCITESLEES